MRFHLCLETGELRSFVNVFLDGVNIRNLDDLETTAPAGATLIIMPSVAGG
jgi:molybdopterin converting factor small subunit